MTIQEILKNVNYFLETGQFDMHLMKNPMLANPKIKHWGYQNHICHKNLHNGRIKPNFKGKVKGTLKYATQMNSIRKQLFKLYPDAIETFGYVTKANCLALGIEKKHYYDACTIATQGKPFVVRTNLYKKKCVPKGDFQKTKGIRSEQPIIKHQKW